LWQGYITPTVPKQSEFQEVAGGYDFLCDKMLVGIPAVAVDRHIRTFVQRAGFRSNNYTAIREVVEEAADRLQVHRTSLDYAIWVHVSQSGG
jgi:hypothetical protein